MEQYNILLGLQGATDELKNSIKKQLEQYEVHANIDSKFTKSGILQSIQDEDKYDVLIISENLESIHPYNPDELENLHETREDLKIVILLNDQRNGSEYVERLFHSGIYTGLFDSSSDFETIASIIKHGRSRKAAKLYYNIQNKDDGLISKDVYIDEERLRTIILYLKDNTDGDFRNRMQHVNTMLDTKEFEYLLERLPEELICEVEAIPEYKNLIVKDTKVSDYPKPIRKINKANKKRLFSNKNDIGDSSSSQSNIEVCSNAAVSKKMRQKESKKERNKNSDVTISEVKEPKVTTVLKPNVTFSLPSINMGFGKDKIIYQTKKTIGVIGLTSKCGTTFTALNIAKAFANKNINNTILEVPGLTKLCIHKRLNFTTIFGNEFYSVQHIIAEGKGISKSESNIYQGIDYYVPDSMKYSISEQWDYAMTMRLLYSTENITIVDIGSNFEKAKELGIFNNLSDVILVVDGRAVDTQEEVFTKLINSINEFGFKPRIVCNFINEKCRFNDFNVSFPIYKSNDNKKNYFVMSKEENEALLDLVGYAKTGHHLKVNQPQKARTIVKTIGNIEIGFMGVSHGVGVTHNSILCANSLKVDNQVCVVEMNNSGHFKRIHKFIEGDNVDKSESIFHYGGVDYIYGMSYSSFSKSYKSDYNYIIIDFGKYDEIYDKDTLYRCNQQFIIASGIEWKLEELTKFIRYGEKNDTNNSWNYLIPFIADKDLKEVRNIVRKSYNVNSIPCCVDPFKSDSNVNALFRNILGLPNNKISKKKFRLLF